MVLEITGPDELEAFLQDKPAQWSHLIASRSALRTLPLALNRMAEVHWLPLLRACFISWVAAEFPAADMRLGASSAAGVASHAASRAVGPVANSANAVALSAVAVAYSAGRSAARYAANAVEQSARSVADSAVWDTVIADARRLESKGSRALNNLILGGLWPIDTEPSMGAAWQEFRQNEQLRPYDYAHWVEWYQTLLDGSHSSVDYFGSDLTLRIARGRDVWWDRPAREVNADIAEWMKEATTRVSSNELEKQIDSLPLPGPASHRMDLRDGRLHAEPVMADGPDAMAQVYLEELREKADDLLQELSAKNADPFVSKAVKRLLEVLPAISPDVEPARVDARGLTIKSIADTYKAQGAEAELFAGAVAQIHDVSLTVQRLCQCYPMFRAMELDALAMGITPEQVPSIAADAADIVAAMQGADICDATATEAFNEAVTAVKEARTPSVASVLAARLVQLVRNALLILLRSSEKITEVVGAEAKSLVQDSYKDARPKLVKLGSRLIRGTVWAALGGAAIPLGKLSYAVPQFKPIFDFVKSLTDKI